jgi:hypothetical protein
MKTIKSSIFVKASILQYSILMLLLISVLNSNAQTYSIINATSTPGVNGEYVENGSYNEKPKYTNGQYTMFHTKDQFMKWAIVTNGTNLDAGDYSNSPYKYSTLPEDDLPPAKGWHNGGNSTGLPVDNIIVTPLNSLGYNKYYFIESLTDDGSIKDTVLIYLYASGVTFTGANDDDFLSEGKATLSNLPAGLTAKLIRTSDTTLIAFIEGNADNHGMKDNIDTLTLTFYNTAVSNNDISVFENSTTHLRIMFQNPFAVTGIKTYPYVNGIYQLEGLYNEKPYFKFNNYYLMMKKCIPRWIIRSHNNMHPLYATQIETYLPSNRQWHNEGYYYSIKDSITVGMVNSIVYSSYSLVESSDNNGTFNDSLEIVYYYPESGESFSGAAGDDFVVNGKVIISNLPEGLTAKVIKYNDTILYAKLEGQEVNHDTSDNINNLRIEFNEDAFTGQGIFMTNNNAADSVNIIHMEKYILVDTMNYYKEGNGLYSPYEIINNHRAFYDQNNYYIVYRNSPPKCVWSVIKEGKMGSAVYSSEADTKDPPGYGWWLGDWNSSTRARIEIFTAQPWLSYSKVKFSESTTQRGAMEDTITIMLNHREGILFTGDDGENYISSGKAAVHNLPENLNPVVIKENDTTVYMYLSGAVINHTTDDNKTDIIIHFTDNAFTEPAENIRYSKKYSINLLFNNIANLDDYSVVNTDNLVVPNPASEIIAVNLPEIINDEISYKLYNIIGETVKTGKLSGDKINVSAISKGMYVLIIDTGKDVLLEKLIIE